MAKMAMMAMMAMMANLLVTNLFSQQSVNTSSIGSRYCSRKMVLSLKRKRRTLS